MAAEPVIGDRLIAVRHPSGTTALYLAGPLARASSIALAAETAMCHAYDLGSPNRRSTRRRVSRTSARAAELHHEWERLLEQVYGAGPDLAARLEGYLDRLCAKLEASPRSWTHRLLDRLVEHTPMHITDTAQGPAVIAAKRVNHAPPTYQAYVTDQPGTTAGWHTLGISHPSLEQCLAAMRTGTATQGNLLADDAHLTTLLVDGLCHARLRADSGFPPIHV